MSVEIVRTSQPSEIGKKRDMFAALTRGWSQSCPACGEGALYSSYLKVNDTCPSCSEELHHQRADDAPPYFTMFVVGHIVVAAVMSTYAMPLLFHAIVWPVVIIALSLWLLPRVKGTLIGLQWANRMHGFGGPEQDAVFDQIPAGDPSRN